MPSTFFSILSCLICKLEYFLLLLKVLFCLPTFYLLSVCCLSMPRELYENVICFSLFSFFLFSLFCCAVAFAFWSYRGHLVKTNKATLDLSNPQNNLLIVHAFFPFLFIFVLFGSISVLLSLQSFPFTTLWFEPVLFCQICLCCF